MRTFGKFRLVEPLASGGMADVWRAEAALAQGVVKEVALKLVRGEHRQDDEFVRMFVEEARLACRLSHANVVQVFEFAEVDGQYYLAMELVRGRHLGQLVERARAEGVRFGLARAVHVAAEAAKALAYVHRQSDAGRPLGLVHRDVSPHNLLVSFEGEVKLADFGIARAMSVAGATEPGTLKGKLAYMAPEQASGASVDARADLFSLGVILWELCTGRRLFARDSEAATLAAVLNGPAPSPPSAWNETVPPELDALVLAALERDPARRIRSADELEARLAGVLLRVARSPEDWDLRAFMRRLWADADVPSKGSRPDATLVRPPPPGVAASTEASAAGEDSAPTRTLARPGAARGLRVAGAGLAAALLLAGAAAVWLRAAPPRGSGGSGAAQGGAEPAARAEPAASVPPAAPADEVDPGGAVPAGEARAGDAAASGPGAASSAPAAAGATAGRSDAPAAADAAGPPGELHVIAIPWGRVAVDGREVGEAPLTMAIAPGRHRVRVTHRSFPPREAVVEVFPGRRTSWTAKLTD